MELSHVSTAGSSGETRALDYPRIVSTPGTCGGKPRIDGHRIVARTIRFHLDECCDPAIAAGLRRRGIDVTTSQEAGLLEAEDEQQAAYGLARRESGDTHS